jgi:4-diphosphocytidyl-2C-methyl-D-erythritol kinase
VSSIDTSITLESGKKLNADVIVGADGPFSVARKAVTGEGSSNRSEPVDCSGEFLSLAYLPLIRLITDMLYSFRIARKVIQDQKNLEGLLGLNEVKLILGCQFSI